MRLSRYGPKAVLILAVLIAWTAACRLGIWSEYLLPSPGRVLKALEQMCLSGELADSIGVSLRRVAEGFFSAFGAALVLGILNGLWPRLADWSRPVIEFLRGIPPLSLIPLLILWCGIGERSKVLLIFLAAFFPMFLSVEKGISGCSRQLLEVGRSFRFTSWQLFRCIILPNAVPDILVGMQIGLGYSWRAIMGAEMIAASSGLGYLILDAQYMARTDKVIGGILVIGVIGSFCSWLLERLIRPFLRNGALYGRDPDKPIM